MSKHRIYFSAMLSTLLFSGVAMADGVQSDLDSDIMYGHSVSHMAPMPTHGALARRPDLNHSDTQNGTDLLHQITVDRVTLSSSPSSPPDRHHDTGDDSPNIIHEVTEHARG